MLVDLRGGCGDKGGRPRVNVVGRRKRKAHSTMILDMKILQ